MPIHVQVHVQIHQVYVHSQPRSVVAISQQNQLILLSIYTDCRHVDMFRPLAFLHVLHQHSAALVLVSNYIKSGFNHIVLFKITYFCSWNLWPTLSLCFKNFSEHFMIQLLSLDVKLAEVKSLTQSSKHFETKLEYKRMKSFICFCSTICWNSCCSLTFN